MNDCEHSVELGAYSDNEMSPEAAARFERHLGECPVCAAELARLRRISDLLSAAVRPDMPEALRQRLHRGVDRVQGSGIRRFAAELAAVAASILLICSAGLAFLSPSSQGAANAPLWEATVISQNGADNAPESAEEQLATWMTQDLTGSSNDD